MMEAALKSSHFIGMTCLKVQVNFGIPLFEGKIDPKALKTQLNLLKYYFFVHNFSNNENTTFALLKALPCVQY
jgi:hypothetical protein